MLLILILFVVGLIVGIISSFFGIGGGVIIVPVLLTLFPEVPPQTVVSSSLGIILFGSLANVLNYRRIGKVPDKMLFIPLGVSISFGCFLGSKIGLNLSLLVINIIFSLTLMLIAFRVLMTTPVTSGEESWKFQSNLASIVKLALSSILAGLVAGITGLGGGSVLVPLFIIFLQMPFNWIPVYANAAIFVGSLSAVITYMATTLKGPIFENKVLNLFQVGYINFGVIILVFCGILISSRIGVFLSQRVSAVVSKRLFVILLLTISLKVMITTLYF